MNVRENYLAALRGEVPEWVPNYGTDVQAFTPSAMGEAYGPLYDEYFSRLAAGKPIGKITATDAFGVSWVLDESGGAMPEPGNFLIDDITEWQESLPIPDLSDYDWDAGVAADLANTDPNKVLQFMLGNGPYMMLVNVMGFEEALVSLASEPEACIEFLEAVTDFQCEVISQTLPRTNCESFQIADDVASANNLFMRPETYRKVIKPFQKKLIDCAKRAKPGIQIDMHCCGKCDAVIDDFVEMGVTSWQPAQQVNDLADIRKRYGNDLVFVGVWDNISVSAARQITEAEVRRSVDEVIDRWAPQGGFIFWDMSMVGTSEELARRLGWADDEAARYGRTIYRAGDTSGADNAGSAEARVAKEA